MIGYDYLYNLLEQKYDINILKNIFFENLSYNYNNNINNEILLSDIIFSIIENKETNSKLIENLAELNNEEIVLKILKHPNCNKNCIRKIFKNFKFHEEILIMLLEHEKSPINLKNLLMFLKKNIDDFTKEDLKIYVYLKTKYYERILYEENIISFNESNQYISKLIINNFKQNTNNQQTIERINKIMYEQGVLLNLKF
jgi:hypothetical protein